MDSVIVDRDGEVLIVSINRPEVRNAVDVATAEALFHAFNHALIQEVAYQNLLVRRRWAELYAFEVLFNDSGVA